MTDQTERLRRALHGCAEEGIVPTGSPWAAIEERVEAGHARPERRRRFAFRTKASWTLAVLTALLLAGTGAYATGGLMDVLDRVFGETVPYVQEHDLSTPVDEKVSREGVTVTINRIYADSEYVAVGYTVEGRDKIARRHGAAEMDVSNWMNLRDARGPTSPSNTRTYETVDGFWDRWAPGSGRPTPPEGAEVGTEVFRASRPLETGEKHRFRAEVFFDGPTRPVPETGSFETERLGRPFFVEVEAHVRPASRIRVDQTIEANGVPITLTRVVNSPAKTSAYLCFEPPERRYDWPLVKARLFEEGRMADAPVYHIDYAGGVAGCAEYAFDESLYGRAGTHSLTVSELHSSNSDAGGSVKGPWRFSFEIPPAGTDQ